MEYKTHARQFVALTARAIEELGNVTIPAVGVKEVFCERNSLFTYSCADGQECYQKGSVWYCRNPPNIPVIVGSVVGAVVLCVLVSVCSYYAKKRKAQTVVAQPAQLQAAVVGVGPQPTVYGQQPQYGAPMQAGGYAPQPPYTTTGYAPPATTGYAPPASSAPVKY
ncbi:hypothetical protein HK104_010184 [Borealophlyctis nickersoniae]|nr:hypothetical protein HK104_010184 [Borealophlyctis nickersoniae]